MKKIPALILIPTIVFALLLSFLSGRVLAAEKPVPPAKVNCADQGNPEFNSSRPYQASPCGDSIKAYFCGNSLQVIEETKEIRAPERTEVLPVQIEMPDKTYAADLTGAQFPIAGNTELTLNSQNSNDQLDPATKVNEYLNWYLNGTTDRAEYGVTDPNQTVDFAGPVKKLLPSAVQDARRIQTINNPLTNVTYSPDTEPQTPGQHPGPTKTVTEPQNHNQIVVCGKSNLGIVGDIFHIGSVTPTPCYKGDGTKAQGEVFRLVQNKGGFVGAATSNSNQNPCSYVCRVPGSVECKRCQGQGLTPIVGGDESWDGNLSFWNGIINDLVQKITSLLPSVPEQAIRDSVGNHWNKRIPPLPWENDPFTGKPMTSLAYQKYYNEWRGKSCVIIPIVNRLFCFDNLLIPNKYADLFPYVPLSNTADKNAKNMITGVGINGIGKTELEKPNTAYEVIQEPVLYFPHTAEVKELSDTLNTTFVPKTGAISTPPVDSTEPNTDPTTGQCRIVNLRSNLGDYLFPEVSPSEVRVHVESYTVTQIPCHDVKPSNYSIQRAIDQGAAPPRPYASCQGQIAIDIRMVTKVPYAEQIFNSTTAGGDSTFRRIFPKVESGAPVSCIANIPTVTGVTYTPTEGISDKNNFKVIGPLGNNTTDNPQLYFPYLGSVYDYFLKGIQTALRPQGFGDPTPESGTLCVSSQAGGDCSFNMSKIGQAIQKAASKYKVPASLLRAIFEIESADEIANPSSYQCRENAAKAAGVTQITRSAYQAVTCSNERIPNDIGVCNSSSGKLSRCNIDDAFELEARVLLWKSGKLNNCKPTGGISLSNKIEWYNAACNYYGSFAPDDLTINYAKDIPASDRRQNGDMNYCDIVCWKLGQCSGNNYPAR